MYNLKMLFMLSKLYCVSYDQKTSSASSERWFAAMYFGRLNMPKMAIRSHSTPSRVATRLSLLEDAFANNSVDGAARMNSLAFAECEPQTGWAACSVGLRHGSMKQIKWLYKHGLK